MLTSVDVNQAALTHTSRIHKVRARSLSSLYRHRPAAIFCSSSSAMVRSEVCGARVLILFVCWHHSFEGCSLTLFYKIPSCFFFASSPVSALRVELGQETLPHRDPAPRLQRRSSPLTSTALSFAPWVTMRISFTRTRSPTASRRFLI